MVTPAWSEAGLRATLRARPPSTRRDASTSHRNVDSLRGRHVRSLRRHATRSARSDDDSLRGEVLERMNRVAAREHRACERGLANAEAFREHGLEHAAQVGRRAQVSVLIEVALRETRPVAD